VIDSAKMREKDPLDRAAWEDAWLRAWAFSRRDWAFNIFIGVVTAAVATSVLSNCHGLICGLWAALAFLAGVGLAWLLLFLFHWALAPRRQRDEARHRIKELEDASDRRDLSDRLRAFRPSIEPVVHRLRYLAGEGAPPPPNVVVVAGESEPKWRGPEVEREHVDKNLLEGYRVALRDAGQPHFAERVVIEGQDLDAHELAKALDRVLGEVERINAEVDPRIPLDRPSEWRSRRLQQTPTTTQKESQE
jgi:hypothetical protein